MLTSGPPTLTREINPADIIERCLLLFSISSRAWKENLDNCPQSTLTANGNRLHFPIMNFGMNHAPISGLTQVLFWVSRSVHDAVAMVAQRQTTQRDVSQRLSPGNPPYMRTNTLTQGWSLSGRPGLPKVVGRQKPPINWTCSGIDEYRMTTSGLHMFMQTADYRVRWGRRPAVLICALCRAVSKSTRG